MFLQKKFIFSAKVISSDAPNEFKEPLDASLHGGNLFRALFTEQFRQEHVEPFAQSQFIRSNEVVQCLQENSYNFGGGVVEHTDENSRGNFQLRVSMRRKKQHWCPGSVKNWPANTSCVHSEL